MNLPSARSTRACGDAVVVAIDSDDAAAARWIEEWVDGWFPRVAARVDWALRFRSSPDAYARALAARPEATPRRPVFAFDTSVLELPTWRDGHRVVVDDAERSCLLTCAPGEIELLASSSSLRWRFTAVLSLLEIVATRLRRSSLDLHAAGVALAGGPRPAGLLVAGPKEAGKTTLLLHLLRSGPWRWMANDRAFVREDDPVSFRLWGVPTVVKIRAGTLAAFPELRRGAAGSERPYLLSLTELAAAASAADASRVRNLADGHAEDLALSPAQLCHGLGVEPCAAAPLGAIVFPRVEPTREGWALEALSSAESRARLEACRFGAACDGRPPTLVEELDGGRPELARERMDRLSRGVAAYALRLGRSAYADGRLAERMAEIAHAGARA